MGESHPKGEEFMCVHKVSKVNILAERMKRYLITSLGRVIRDASPQELFQALSYALREEVMINWSASAQSIYKKNPRRLYYISMEYLPGRLLANNISSLEAHGLVKKVIQTLGLDYRTLLVLEPDPGLGNGGLGRLASCLLDALATHNYPAMGYGLRYQYGIFEQQLFNGVQVEMPDCWLLNTNPWEFRRDRRAQTVKFSGLLQERKNPNGETIFDISDYEEVRALPFDFPVVGYSPHDDFSVRTLRLWSTKESPHNFHLQRYNAGQIGPAAENTALTDVLYPNDNNDTGKRIRLKQEFLLVSASLQDIIHRHLKRDPHIVTLADKVRIQINDTHPALIVVELLRKLTEDFHIAWEQAKQITASVCSYTNHTILKEALEEWNEERLSCLLPRQYQIIARLNQELCQKTSEPHSKKEVEIISEGQIKMAHLAIACCHKVNGVAKLHGEILKQKVFPTFEKLFPGKFTHVTNGVSQRHWLLHCNPILAHFISERIGKDWIQNFSCIEQLRDFANDPSTLSDFLEVKRKNKQRLIHHIEHEMTERDLYGRPVKHRIMTNLDSSSLFDVHVKRVHEYKRQLMNGLNLLMIYFDLLENPQSRLGNRTALLSGKAAAGYELAKNTVQFIYCVARLINQDPRVNERLKVIFIENYSVSEAEIIIPAAELSQQISTAGKEASGTGNMKLAMNGALTIGTQDGANLEMMASVKDPFWPFSFGSRAEELQALSAQKSYHPWDIISSHPKIKRAVDTLKDGTLAQNNNEIQALSQLQDALLLGFGGQRADRYFVLYDLQSYYETQKKVETFYQDKNRYAAYALHNIAGMGPFSADVAINNYAKKIWGIKPCPMDPALLTTVRAAYSEFN